MSTNLIMQSVCGASVPGRAKDVAMPLNREPQIARWFLVGVQVLALLTYATGIAFLVKTTAGTLVLFSLLAPILVAVAALILIAVAIYEFRKHHGVSVFELYDPGQVIFRQGELGDCAYFIQSGEVEMIRQQDGAENVIAKFSEGDYFGEKALIRSGPRTATVRAARQTRVGVIRKRRFLTMIVVMPARRENFIGNKSVTGRTRKFIR